MGRHRRNRKQREVVRAQEQPKKQRSGARSRERASGGGGAQPRTPPQPHITFQILHKTQVSRLMQAKGLALLSTVERWNHGRSPSEDASLLRLSVD